MTEIVNLHISNKMPCRIIAIFVLLVLTNLTVFGTAQYPDKIIYKGKEYSLHSNPMEKYFAQYPDKRPEGGMSTALWRGYVATFEIKDNQLYLKDIEVMNGSTKNDKGYYETIWKSVLNEVFPNQELVKIDWMTGLLVLPYGKMVNYVHMGYGSTYANYILLEIDKGELKTEKQFKNKQYEKFKENQFQAFKKTEEYEKIKTDLKKEDNYDDKFIDSFLRSFVIEYTSKILE